MIKTEEAGIYKRPDGRYVVRATAKCQDTGRMKESQRTLRAGQTLQDAMQMRDEIKGALSSPSTPQLAPQPTTVADYAERWLVRNSRRWKPSTKERNLNCLTHHILPELGHVYLDRLTRKDISGWIAHQETKQMPDGRLYTTATVGGWWRVLRAMLRDCYAEGHLGADITLRLRGPTTDVEPRRERETLSAGQLAEVVEAARQHTRYAEIVTLAYTGMRAGELYGLHWEDIDEATKMIHIKRSAHKGQVGTTKTGAIRSVPMVGIVEEALQAHRQQMIRDQHPGLAAGIVFPSDKGGYRYRSSIRKPLKLIGEVLGLEVSLSPQVFRRTFNTLLLQAQVDRITIRSMIGHSSEQMTEHYAGIPTQMKKEALGTLLGTSLPHLGPVKEE